MRLRSSSTGSQVIREASRHEQPSRARASSGLRSRYLGLLFDAALTARLRSGVPTGSRKYRRAQRLTQAVASVFPAAFARLVDNATVTTGFPFVLEDVTLLGYGSCVTTFLARTAGPVPTRMVMKVYRKSLGRPLDAIMSLIQERRACYDTLVSWFHDCDVMLPTHFAVLHGPVLSIPAAGSISPYVPGPHTDLFADITRPELLQRLAENPQLRAQFRRFVECTLRAAEGGSCIDLVGRHNLVLADNGKGPRLVVLDNGISNFEHKRVTAPWFLDLIRQRLDYLGQIYDRTEK